MSNAKNNNNKGNGDARRAVRVDETATPLQNFNGGRRAWTQTNGRKQASKSAARGRTYRSDSY